MSAYATAADLVLAYDQATIADLASDTGQPAATLTGNAVVEFALSRASGQVDAAATVGRAYSADDLAAITGTAQSLLKGLVCDLAMIFLMERRPEKFNDQALEQRLERVEKYLEALRQGERVFGVAANQDAGLPTIDGPTALEFQDLNMITQRVQHYYPAMGSRLPLGR